MGKVTSPNPTGGTRICPLESIPNDSVCLCEDTYAKTVIRTEAGRYVATLPFKSPPVSETTEFRALKCFYHLEGKLDRDPILKRQYLELMRFIVKSYGIPDSEVLNPRRYYLPHHGIRKNDSTSTKLRVVFKASAKDSEGRSLNGYLEKETQVTKRFVEIAVKIWSSPNSYDC
ncbi:hypothetical protein AVEN_56748-1 [Araneus ventricosus]|uniref:Uncharacterized protein n=1 Tax=Araneus ventricosus TaxID=182803 RepID=A0A4Y2ITP7_ARAVE|nr:hypothetical protein AVEN_56748-1 [Araneus ventricosus]